MSQDKIDAIKEYLESSIPGSEVEHRNDFDSGGEKFKATLGETTALFKPTALLKVSREFIDDNTKDVVVSLLQRWDTVREMLADTTKGVQVKTSGLSCFDRN